jgi:hypothetical protein
MPTRWNNVFASSPNSALQSHVELNLEASNQCGDGFHQASKELHTDREFVIKAVRKSSA